jgi:hypothetical protein
VESAKAEANAIVVSFMFSPSLSAKQQMELLVLIVKAAKVSRRWLPATAINGMFELLPV